MVNDIKKLKHPAEIVLKALFMGHAVKLGKDTYLMSDDNFVGVEEGENVRVYHDRDLAIGLNDFIKLCGDMPEEDVVGLAASVALTGRNGRRRR